MGEEHVALDLSSTQVTYPLSVAIREYFRVKPGSQINILLKKFFKNVNKKRRARKKEAGGDEKLIFFYGLKSRYVTELLQ